MSKIALFIRFINKEVSVSDILYSFSRSTDDVYTQNAIERALNSPPDLENFRKELAEAVSDLVKDGLGDEFKAFVNNYMENALEEDLENKKSELGENISRNARVKDDSAQWVEALLCYNLCLYIKAFGLENLKQCRICNKYFDHKGKWAVYCNDSCKNKKQV